MNKLSKFSKLALNYQTSVWEECNQIDLSNYCSIIVLNIKISCINLILPGIFSHAFPVTYLSLNVDIY